MEALQQPILSSDSEDEDYVPPPASRPAAAVLSLRRARPPALQDSSDEGGAEEVGRDVEDGDEDEDDEDEDEDEDDEDDDYLSDDADLVDHISSSAGARPSAEGAAGAGPSSGMFPIAERGASAAASELPAASSAPPVADAGAHAREKEAEMAGASSEEEEEEEEEEEASKAATAFEHEGAVDAVVTRDESVVKEHDNNAQLEPALKKARVVEKKDAESTGTDVDQMWASMNAPRGKDVTKEDVMSTFKVPRLQDLESDSVAQNAAATQPAPGGRGRGTGLEDALEVVRKSKGSHVLEQTRSNWSQFKKVKDIDQELDNYKKDKNRYTDRLAFLARSDIREWEAEQHAKNKSTR